MPSKKITSDNEVPELDVDGVIDPAIYNQIARCAEILSVQLIESDFNISPSYFDRSNSEKLNVEFSDIHASFDEKSKIATCVFQFESYKKISRKKVFSIKDKFVAFYRISADCDELHALAFVKKTGLLACYPYFRAHAAQTASLANADMPILPTIASMPVKEKVKREDA